MLKYIYISGAKLGEKMKIPSLEHFKIIYLKVIL